MFLSELLSDDRQHAQAQAQRQAKREAKKSDQPGAFDRINEVQKATKAARMYVSCHDPRMSPISE